MPAALAIAGASGAAPVLAAALKKGFLKEQVETSVNTYLVNTGSKLVLIDTGAAGLFGPTLGNLVANMKAAGYQPEQIDEIYITHMHADHVGGLMVQGALAFPNAVCALTGAYGVPCGKQGRETGLVGRLAAFGCASVRQPCGHHPV